MNKPPHREILITKERLDGALVILDELCDRYGDNEGAAISVLVIALVGLVGVAEARRLFGA